MIDLLMWIVSGFALIGVILNIYKRQSCFVIWIFTNFAHCIYCFHKTAYPQSALFAVYFGLAIWGVIKWKQPKLSRYDKKEHLITCICYRCKTLMKLNTKASGASEIPDAVCEEHHNN